jgi:hypothetical protein
MIQPGFFSARLSTSYIHYDKGHFVSKESRYRFFTNSFFKSNEFDQFLTIRNSTSISCRVQIETEEKCGWRIICLIYWASYNLSNKFYKFVSCWLSLELVRSKKIKVETRHDQAFKLIHQPTLIEEEMKRSRSAYRNITASPRIC